MNNAKRAALAPAILALAAASALAAQPQPGSPPGTPPAPAAPPPPAPAQPPAAPGSDADAIIRDLEKGSKPQQPTPPPPAASPAPAAPAPTPPPTTPTPPKAAAPAAPPAPAPRPAPNDNLPYIPPATGAPMTAAPAPVPTLGAPVTTAPAPTMRAPIVSTVERPMNAGAMLREGSFLASRKGRMTRSSSGDWVFTFDNAGQPRADPPMTLMPCQNLAAMEKLVERGGDALTFTLSGQVFVYKGRNHLLPTLFVVSRRSDLAPAQ